MRGHGDEIRSLLLNNNQIALVNFVKHAGTLRASLLSHLECISIQNASSKLNTLYTKGYLTRTSTASDSGGIEYFYEIK